MEKEEGMRLQLRQGYDPRRERIFQRLVPKRHLIVDKKDSIFLSKDEILIKKEEIIGK